MRLHLVAAVGLSLRFAAYPPLFLKFVHFILKNTLEFSGESSANLGPNKAKFMKEFGGFESKLWPGPRHHATGFMNWFILVLSITTSEGHQTGGRSPHPFYRTMSADSPLSTPP